eukprot:m.30837 g.30837  ORF g.30837 m.30837 type:complete len:127 (+) comp9564_c0_seq1:37-417(+)
MKPMCGKTTAPLSCTAITTATITATTPQHQRAMTSAHDQSATTDNHGHDCSHNFGFDPTLTRPDHGHYLTPATTITAQAWTAAATNLCEPRTTPQPHCHHHPTRPSFFGFVLFYSSWPPAQINMSV